MEGIPGIPNFDFSRIEELSADLQEQKMKWENSLAQKPQAQEPQAEEPQDKAVKPKAAQPQQGAKAGEAKGAGRGVDGMTGASPAAGAAGGGEPIINKNGTRMNAQEVATIADIFKKAGKSGMKPEELANKLRERGIEAEVTKINGHPAIKFANGDAFVDTSANGVLDTDDKEWVEALNILKGKYGANAPQLQGGSPLSPLANAGGLGGLTGVGGDGQAVTPNNAADIVNAFEQNTQLQRGEAGGPQLPNPTGEGKGQDSGQLKSVMAELDGSLGEKGYKGSTAEELLQKGELESVLGKYGIQMPDELERKSAGDFVNNLFRDALLIASIK
ncbi:MAG: hypothetical protein RDV48_13980 [Candidatus Eremiobacteraeota bacterium]|nr:hypothetical protein [Candidatus Eremiobacteraeota bacterium]